MNDGYESHSQVWDDSALVDSWNDAFEEYKKYHSLANKGQMIAVSTTGSNESVTNGTETPHAPAGEENSARDHEPEATPVANGDDRNEVSISAATQPTPVAAVVPGTVAVPQALLASVQNEELKNLMMSWYYSGYYTGLYEGKQQGYALAMQQAQGG